jgi:PST family polysaccharide transporter
MSVSRGKTANSLLWSAVENGGLAVISLCALIIYSRILSASDFGLFSIVLSVVELVGIFTNMLFHDALVQQNDVTDLHYDTAFSVTMVGSLFLLAICWAISPTFAAIVHQPKAASLLIWMSLFFPCSGLGVIIIARQRRQFAFRALALRSLVGRVLGGGIGVAAAVMGAGVWSLVVQQILMVLIGSVMLWMTCDRAPRLRFGYSEFKQLTAFGIFSVGGLFVTYSIKRVFTILTGVMLGMSAAGYLNLSFRVVDMFWVIASASLTQVALPMLAGLRSDLPRLKRAYNKSVEFSCLILYPCFVLLGSTAPELVRVLFGRQWAPSAPYMAALGFLVLLQAPRLFVSPVLIAMGRPWDPLVGLVVGLVFMGAAVAMKGLPSLPWALCIWVATECAQVPISGWMLRRATGYTVADQLHGVPTPLAAALAMAAAVAVARQMFPAFLGPIARVAILLPVGGVAFVGVVLLVNRQLVGEFFDFIRASLSGKWLEISRPGAP